MEEAIPDPNKCQSRKWADSEDVEMGLCMQVGIKIPNPRNTLFLLNLVFVLLNRDFTFLGLSQLMEYHKKFS